MARDQALAHAPGGDAGDGVGVAPLGCAIGITTGKVFCCEARSSAAARAHEIARGDARLHEIRPARRCGASTRSTGRTSTSLRG